MERKRAKRDGKNKIKGEIERWIEKHGERGTKKKRGVLSPVNLNSSSELTSFALETAKCGYFNIPQWLWEYRQTHHHHHHPPPPPHG